MSTPEQVNMKLEVVLVPVSDVERAAQFYRRLGWRQDADTGKGDERRLQFTPPGSSCSVMIRKGVAPAAPGTTQFLHLAVSDVCDKQLSFQHRRSGEVFTGWRPGDGRE